jgi:hypothetical protein
MNMSVGGAASASLYTPRISSIVPPAQVSGRSEEEALRHASSSGVDRSGQPAGGPPPGAAPGATQAGGPPPSGPPPGGAGGKGSDLASLFKTAKEDDAAPSPVLASEEGIVQALLENARLVAESEAKVAATDDAHDGAASADAAAAAKKEDAQLQMSEGRRAAQMFESQLSVLRATFVGEDVAVTDLRI